MKEQKVIVSTNAGDFEKRIENDLKEGWRVIPESLKSTSDVSSHWAGSNPYGGQSEVNKVYSFTVVLERERHEREDLPPVGI